jgi:hypothetical protein
MLDCGHHAAICQGRVLTINSRPRPHSSLQPWHPSSWLMQPLRLVFSFDHLTNVLFCLGPSTSLNAPSLADPCCRQFSAPDHTQALPPLPLLLSNRLAQRQPRLLDLFQDYAKHAADNGITTVVFMSSEGRVPRRIMGKSWSHFDCYVLIMCCREKLVVKKWGHHRNWRCEQRGSSSVLQTLGDR